MTLTVEQLITALDAKSIHYVLKEGFAKRYHFITFDCPYSKKHSIEFEVYGVFMTQSTATFCHRINKRYETRSNGEKYKAKLLEFLTK